MGRPESIGLSYFPFNVDFFQDLKVRFISGRFGEKGLIILIKIFCEIYKDKGYYIDWNEDLEVLLSQESGRTLSVSLFKDVVQESLKRGIFDNDIFKKFAVLTSNGIQKRYIKACKDSKRKIIKINPHFDLIEFSSGKTTEETELTTEETELTTGESTQRKEKESKVNKSKIQKNEEFENFWELYGKKKDRDYCLKKFNTLTTSEIERIFETLQDYIKSTPDVQYRKNPKTYLNSKSWNDEIIFSTTNVNIKNGIVKSNYKQRQEFTAVDSIEAVERNKDFIRAAANSKLLPFPE